MNKTTKFGAMGIAMLFVLAMSAVPSASAKDLTQTIDAHSCDLSTLAAECEGEPFIGAGERPALSADVTAVFAEGTITVRVAETANPDYYVETAYDVTIVAGDITVNGQSTVFGPWGSPWAGYEQMVTANYEGTLVGIVTATAE